MLPFPEASPAMVPVPSSSGETDEWSDGRSVCLLRLGWDADRRQEAMGISGCGCGQPSEPQRTTIPASARRARAGVNAIVGELRARLDETANDPQRFPSEPINDQYCQRPDSPGSFGRHRP